MSTSLRQQSFFRNLNASLRRQQAYFNSWNSAFYENLEWEIYPGVSFPLNYKRSTKIFLDRNNIETYTGYTTSNGPLLSGDPSVTSVKINPEYYKLDVKTGPALYINQSDGQVMISKFYTDIRLSNDKFTIDYQTGDVYSARDITADRHITTTGGNVYVETGNVYVEKGNVYVEDGFIDVINPTTSPGIKITQTGGTGNSFLVYDQTLDNTPFVIDNAGKTGISTENPAASLDVRGTASQTVLAVNSNKEDSDFQFGSTSTDYLLFGDASTSRIAIGTNTPAGTLHITGTANVSSLVVNPNNTDSDFQFGSISTDYLLFGDAGTSRIGIGTPVPTGTLDIRGTASVSALVVNSNNTDSDFQFGSIGTDYLLFGDAGSNRVGINTSVPTGTLDIFGTANVSSLVVNANNADSDFQFGSTGTDYLLYGDASNNRIGIGTSVPTVKLEIHEPSTAASATWSGGTDFVKLFATNSAWSEQAIAFQEINTDVGAKIGVKNTGNGAYDILFANRLNTGSTTVLTEKMRITNTGRVGINISDPTGTLEISAVQNVSSLVVNAANADSDFQFGSVNTDFLIGGDASTSRVCINKPTNTPAGTLEVWSTNAVPSLVVNANNLVSDFQIGSSTTDFMLYGAANNSRIGINTNNPNNELSIVGSVSATNRNTFNTYTITGVLTSGIASGTLTVDADLYSRVRWTAGFVGSGTLSINNLTEGEEIISYIRHTASTAYNITIQASTTTSGHTNVECSVGGALSKTSVTLAGNGGAATIWVARLGGAFVGAIY